MKKLLQKTDWLVQITTCLAAGGIGMVVVLCLFIGFGLNTAVGKEALYLGAMLILLNLLVIRRWEARLQTGMTKILRRVHAAFVGCWIGGAAFLLFALVPGLCGVGYGAPWVKLPCLVGTIFLPLGWLGNLVTYARRKSAEQVASRCMKEQEKG